MLITNTILGIFMMIVFCILLGSIFSWLYLNTKSPWVAALGHGSVNAVAGLPVLFFQPEFNMALGGTLASPVAWIGMGLLSHGLSRRSGYQCGANQRWVVEHEHG